MQNQLVVNAEGPEIRVAVVEEGSLAEFFVERKRDRGIVGNIYRGKVTRVLPGMQAAFVDFIHRLDPSDLRERFDRGLKRGGLLGAANKTKYWDLYTELYQTLAQMKDDLPHVFVETFARSYEEKVQELAARKTRGAERTPAANNS